MCSSIPPTHPATRWKLRSGWQVSSGDGKSRTTSPSTSLHRATDADRFRHWLEMTIDDKRVRVETTETSDPTMIAPIDNPFLDAVRNALARHVPDAVAFPLQTPGATDSRHYRARSIPSYGFGPFVIDTKELACMHGIDERFSIDNLKLGIKIACDVIEELCAT